MSKTSDLLTACFLRNRWSVQNNTTNASCQATSPTPKDSISRSQIEALWYSIENATAAAYTVDVQVRGAAHTVLSTTRQVVATGASVAQQLLGMGLPSPKRGVAFEIAATPPASSVYMSLTAAGWIDDANG